MRLTSRLVLAGVAITLLAGYGVLRTHFVHEEHAGLHSRGLLYYTPREALLATEQRARGSSAIAAQAKMPDGEEKSSADMKGDVAMPSDDLEAFLKPAQTNLIEDALTVAMTRLFPLANASSLESAVVCQEPAGNRSCVFRNLYWYQNGYWLFVVGSPKIPDHRISFASKFMPDVQMPVRSFRTLQELHTFVLKGNFLTWSRLTLIFAIMWHHNVGHALFDGLWPAFLALVKFDLHALPFRALIDIDAWHEHTRYLIEEILDGFCGDRIEKMYNLTRSNIRFEVAVAGSKSMGQRHMNAEVSLAGGRELDASRLFRNRMYAMHGVPMSSSRQEMIGIIIRNRRFSQGEEAMLRDIRIIDGMTFEFIDWSMITPFKAQLMKLRTVGVHVSSIGTGQMYQTFLLNGAVHVNLGTVGEERQALIPWFMEQYMAEGAPYLRALYYNSSKRVCGLDRKEVESLLHRAVQLHRVGFPMPVLAGENLSPEGRIFRELCSQGKCEELLASMNPTRDSGHPSICARDAWVEYVVYEQGGWSTSGWKENGVVGYCPVDRQALRELKRKYDLAPYVQHGGKVDCQDGAITQIHQPSAERLRCKCRQVEDEGTLLSWDLVKTGKVCFKLAVLENAEFFVVENEHGTFPQNGITLQADSVARFQKLEVSSFRIMKALHPQHQSGFSLESCRNPGHYLRHMNGRLLISRPSQRFDPDAGWFFGPPERKALSTDTCGVFGASYNDEMFIYATHDVVGLERAKGTCLEFRVPSEFSAPPPFVRAIQERSDKRTVVVKDLGTLPESITKNILAEGQGRTSPSAGDKVTVHYACKLAATNRLIDSSRQRDHTFTFTLGGGELIPGWDMAVATMKKSERASFTIPAEYAYGHEVNYADIPSGAALLFEIEVLHWKASDPFHCQCSNGASMITWKAAHEECFHIYVDGSAPEGAANPLYLSVQSEGLSYPANEAFSQTSSLQAVSIKVVKALSKYQDSRGAFSLQSCTHPENFVLHSNGRVLLSPASSQTEKDTGWLPTDMDDIDTCGMLRPFVDDTLALKLTIESTQLEKRSGTCVHWSKATQ